jgi:serine/threonine protein kinase
MFVMLVGEFPYVLERGSVPVETIERGLGELGANPGLVRISEAGRNLLSRMLQIRPDERISAADALSHEWFMQSENEGQIAAKEGSVEVVMADQQGLCWR